jgi:hypothetical protein
VKFGKVRSPTVQIQDQNGRQWRWSAATGAELRAAARDVAAGVGADWLLVLLRPGLPAEVLHRPAWATSMRSQG